MMLKRIALASATLCAAVLVTGCAYMKGGTDLSEVADNAGLANVTTGDGTFENYTATGHYTGTEVGIGIGIPGIGTLVELYPAQTNEDLLTNVATTAKDDQAENMINVTPAKSLYTGIPFVILGIYVDKADGTGIRAKR